MQVIKQVLQLNWVSLFIYLTNRQNRSMIIRKIPRENYIQMLNIFRRDNGYLLPTFEMTT